MSLTVADLQQIKIIMRDTIHETVPEIVYKTISATVPSMIEEALMPLKGEVQAFRNDVREIYDWMAKHDKKTTELDAHVKLLELSALGTS